MAGRGAAHGGWQRGLASLVLLVGPAAAFFGCGGSGGSGGGTGAPFGLTQRETPQLQFPVAGAGAPAGALTVERAFPNLTFQRPVAIAALPDGSGELVVVEQAGRILRFAPDDATSSASVFLDISARVSRAGEEEGLLGLAFDPDYAANGWLYVHYSAAGPRRSVIARFDAPSRSAADPASELVLLEVGQPFANHNGGALAFGPDRMLYVGLGDGGSGGDPQNHGQDTSTLLGSILRIDPHGGAPYGVPADNPFVGGPGRDEIWAHGLRNAWRFSFDRATGRLWVGDVGQGAREEVSVAGRGANLGWRVFEGDADFDNPGGLPPTAFTQPVVAYDRSQGSTVIGGHVYRGARMPAHQGTYVYGDYGSGRVWALEVDGSLAVQRNEEIARVPQLTSFGEDAAGELYAVSLAGTVWRLVEGGGGGGGAMPFPQRLSATGLFRDLATLEPSPGVVEYAVNAPLWSDGAEKRRWIALPGGTTIGFAPTGAWTFPVGTVLVKHFEIEVSPGVRERLETRVLIHEEAGRWVGYSYRWNAAQTDADLLPGALDVPLTVSGPQGAESFVYRIPDRASCLTCHNAAAGPVLGVRTRQLKRPFAYPAATDDQLRAWSHVGFFDRPVDATAHAALPDPGDAALPLEERARAYLAVNCAVCHQPGAPGPAGIDLRFDTALGATNLVDVTPTEGDLGLSDPRRIAPGSKERSVLWERMGRTDAERMPPLGRERVDAAARDLLGAWIDGL